MHPARPTRPSNLVIAIKISAAIAVEVLAVSVALFYGAGTDDWTTGWAFLLIATLSAIPAISALLIHDPQLLDARTRLSPKGQPLADRLFVPAHSFMMLVWAAVAGYDAGRLGWSHVPMSLRLAAALFIPVGTWLAYQTMRQNPYLTTCVHIQTDRGHQVVDTGAYSIVRHPFYLVTIAYQLSASLLLGSWMSVLVSLIIAAMIAVRIFYEEDHLERNLQGYAEYKCRTQWRLIPGLW